MVLPPVMVSIVLTRISHCPDPSPSPPIRDIGQ